MKSFATILALGLITAINAQDQCSGLVSKIPTCAIKCIDEAASSAGCSGPSDLACQCKNTDKINAAALNCVLNSCGAQQGLEVQSAAAAVCECVATAAPAAAASTPAASATQKASSAEATTSAAEAPTSKAAATTLAPYPVSQAADGQVQAGTAASTASAGFSPSESTVPFTGSGVTVGASVSGVMLAFMAAVALL